MITKHVPSVILGTFIMISVIACAQKPIDEEAASPAHITAPSTQVYAELRSIIAAVLHQKTVLLAEDVFVENHLLVMAQPDLTGRVLEAPQRFQLLKQGHQCMLEHINTQQRWPLLYAQCQVHTAL